MRRKMIKRASIAGIFFMAVFFAGLIQGCGKKTLPVPPTPFNPPPVQNLNHVITEGSVILSFSFPENGNKKEMPVSGFFVDRAKRLLSEGHCETCPAPFKRIAEIRKGKGEGYTFKEPIETGYRYIYKVTPFSDHGKKGLSPSTLQFDY